MLAKVVFIFQLLGSGLGLDLIRPVDQQVIAFFISLLSTFKRAGVS